MRVGTVEVSKPIRAFEILLARHRGKWATKPFFIEVARSGLCGFAKAKP